MFEIFTSFFLGLIVLFLLSLYKVNLTGPRNQAPGPFRLPFIGNLVQIAWINHEEPYLAFSKLAEKYGNVFKIQLGSISSVVFNSFDVMEEYLSKPEFSDRLFTKWVGERSFQKRLGIAFSPFPNPWHELKRFSLRTLKDVGFGKRNRMHSIIQAELMDVVNELKADSKKGKDGIVTFENYFTLSSLNLIWSFIADKRFEHTNPKLLSLIKIMTEFLKCCNLGNSIMFAFPEWMDWFPDLTGTTILRKCYKEMNIFFQEFIDERRSLGLYKTSPENFVDEFLQEIDAHKGQQVDDKGCEYSDQQLVSIMHDFFFAGSETSSNTLAWLILHCIRNPEVQEKLQTEIDSFLPQGTFPDVEHEPKLHYVRATIAETHRIASILPLMIPRATTQDTFCGENLIPKGTYIITNLHAVHHDKTYWKDPEAFRPERFLDDDGKYKGDPRLKPFGFGKRSCIGEPLATMSLFHYVTVIMQNFTFHAVPNEPLPSVKPVMGITNGPQPYRAVVECRH